MMRPSRPCDRVRRGCTGSPESQPVGVGVGVADIHRLEPKGRTLGRQRLRRTRQPRIGRIPAKQAAAEPHVGALAVLSKYDEGPDLVLYYKRLMVLEGHSAYAHHFDATDALGVSQAAFLEAQWRQFRCWWDAWPGRK